MIHLLTYVATFFAGSLYATHCIRRNIRMEVRVAMLEAEERVLDRCSEIRGEEDQDEGFCLTWPDGEVTTVSMN